MTLFLKNEEVEQVLTMDDAIAGMEIAFSDLAKGEAVNRPRSHSYAQLAEDTFYCLKTMDGVIPRLGVAAIRLASDITYEPSIGGLRRLEKLRLLPGNKYLGLVLLFSIHNGELLAIMQDGFLQTMRVGATSALAARCLARENSHVVGLFGTGGQAGPQLQGLCAVRKISKVKLYSPNEEHRRNFARIWEKRLEIEIQVEDEARPVVQGVDIVAPATSSLDPVFSGDWLEPGQHVNSLQSGELDRKTYERASVVATRATERSTFYMTGKQIPRQFLKTQHFTSEFEPKLRTLGGLLNKTEIGRTSTEEITLFGGTGTGPSSGLGIQFAAVGIKIYEAARKKGLGWEIDSELFCEDIQP